MPLHSEPEKQELALGYLWEAADKFPALFQRHENKALVHKCCSVLDAMTRSEGFFPEEIVQLMSFMVQSANFLESLSETESSLY